MTDVMSMSHDAQRLSPKTMGMANKTYALQAHMAGSSPRWL